MSNNPRKNRKRPMPKHVVAYVDLAMKVSKHEKQIKELRNEIKELKESIFAQPRNRYVCWDIAGQPRLFYGYPLGHGNWNMYGSYPINNLQKDTVKHGQIFLEKEVNITKIQGEEIAIIRCSKTFCGAGILFSRIAFKSEV